MFKAFRAVFWSFFGVRKKDDYKTDADTLTPQQVILAGIVSALAFVMILVGIVYLITR